MKKVLIVLIVLSSLPAASDTQPGLVTSSTLPGTGRENLRDGCGETAGPCMRRAL